MMYSSFVLALLGASALATEQTQMPQGAFSYGAGHGSFAAHSGDDHKHGQFHKNPWQHTVVHHKTANDYHKDPWINRSAIASKDTTRDSWYSPYQQFSPPQVQYKPSVSHAIFAKCDTHNSSANGGYNYSLGPTVQFAQMKGKAFIIKRNFCSASTSLPFIEEEDTLYYNYIMEFGTDTAMSNNNDETALCQQMGSVFNPLQEVDKFGRRNPFQDPNRGTIPSFTGIYASVTGVCDNPGTAAIGGFQDLEPINILHNLEGVESIMGRSYYLTDTEITEKDGYQINPDRAVEEDLCCVIARAEAPEGFGPKPIPFPLTTHSSTYNSYGMNYAVPLPYHKHGYQSNADNSSYNHHVGAHHIGIHDPNSSSY